MPELPEMETYRQHLQRRCLGRRITRVEVGRAKSLNVPVAIFKSSVQGAALTHFSRAGKHLVFHLSNGLYLLNHLMLGGGIFHGTAAEAPTRTFQVILHFDDDTSLYWFGLRLGWLHLLTEAERQERLAGLGVDPLSPEFTLEHLTAQLHARRGALKPLLVDQKRFPGVGNCYSDESCWGARIHPLRPANSLSGSELEQLWRSMCEALTDARALGGYTETPFHSGDTFTGGYLPHLKVYDRQGQPCPRCGSPIAYTEASGRKVFACLHCQPTDQPALSDAFHPDRLVSESAEIQ